MSYDVLVVGAGAAGAVLAARLSEDPKTKVLLLEAGPDYRSADQPPEMRSANPFNLLLPSHFQDKYMYPDLMARRTKRQQHRVYWRGRGLGGSTAVNGQIAIRGLLHAFHRWEEMGCTGWSGAEVLPYFMRLEDDPLSANFHGSDGPIPIHRARIDNWGNVDKAMRESALALGHAWHDDLNAPGSEGICTYPINSRDGKRVSVNDGYIEPARDRPNLTIIGDATVDRVLFEGHAATGVRAIVSGVDRQFHAPLVILSAGAIHSPAILQRSGVGPAALLAEKGIAVKADLPVGEGFFDHPYCRIELKLKQEFKATDVNARHTNCCVRMSSNLPGSEKDDILYVAMNHGGIGVESDSAQFGEAMINLILMEAKSRGSVAIRSADPFDQPVVEENMLDDPLDLARMCKAYRHLGEIARQAPIQEISERILLGDSDLPLSWLDTASDEELGAFLLAQSSDAQHGIGGCCMGREGSAVVDPECRVYGFEGLRVIDASIMPLDCQANTNLTAIMIGEKMAESLRRSAPDRSAGSIAMDVYQRLKDLGLTLPKTPAPGGNYVPAKLCGDLLYLAGLGPGRPDGTWHTGKVGKDVTWEEAHEHARIVGLQMLGVVDDVVGDLNRVEVIKVFGMVNAVPEFTDHPKVINGCSDILVAVLGEAGRHARSAVGMGSLPNGMTVEVEAILRVKPR